MVTASLRFPEDTWEFRTEGEWGREECESLAGSSGAKARYECLKQDDESGLIELTEI